MTPNPEKVLKFSRSSFKVNLAYPPSVGVNGSITTVILRRLKLRLKRVLLNS